MIETSPVSRPRESTTGAATVAAALEVTNLRTSFRTRDGGRIEALKSVSFSIAAGQTLVLLGESGSGKSVTARSILRLHGHHAEIEGSVLLAGESLLELSDKQMTSVRGAQVALIPQDPSAALDALRRVGQQLSEVLLAHRVVATRSAARARAIELLGQVGLPEPERLYRAYPHELSGGMRQRVAIAIALSCDPVVLIADEPTTALDVTVQAQILELFAELQQRLSTALLMVTHDVLVAADIADVIAVMYAGRIVEIGSVDKVLGSPRHPYTRALLGALPRPGVTRGALESIPGTPPVAGTMHRGCAFAERCSLAVDTCRETPPGLVAVVGDHHAACPILNPNAEVV